MKPLKIVDVSHVGEYRLSIKFDDGKVSVVDFWEFLDSSLHLQIKKYKKMEKFLSFRVDNGDLEWDDYELCFPIYDLYTGEILKKSEKALYLAS